MSNVRPLKATRAVREPGKRMRSRLLDAAVELFKDQGLAGVAVADIAAAAGAFPSQITYYFRTKEALFVEAACREVLYVARQAEEEAARPKEPPGQPWLDELIAGVSAFLGAQRPQARTWEPKN